MTDIKVLYPKANITVLEIDHLSLASVVSAAKYFLSKEPKLHGLVNNAGIMATPFEVTKDGHEAQFQTNYLAHWVLTSYLLPLMLETSKTLPPGSVRIVNLSSAGHWSAPSGGINFSDLRLQGQSGQTRYGQSKLADVLHMKTLHKLYGPGSPSAKAGKGEIWTSAVHPGLCDSQLGAKAVFPPGVEAAFALVWRFVSVDGDTGSWTNVFCVASPEMKANQSGTYFQRIAEAGWQSRSAKDPKLADRLEEWTAKKMHEEGWF